MNSYNDNDRRIPDPLSIVVGVFTLAAVFASIFIFLLIAE